MFVKWAYSCYQAFICPQDFFKIPFSLWKLIIFSTHINLFFAFSAWQFGFSDLILLLLSLLLRIFLIVSITDCVLIVPDVDACKFSFVSSGSFLSSSHCTSSYGTRPSSRPCFWLALAESRNLVGWIKIYILLKKK